MFFFRLSQDLAKDLAILAREIHDVAGDGGDGGDGAGGPQIPSAENPALDSTLTAHEQVCL